MLNLISFSYHLPCAIWEDITRCLKCKLITNHPLPWWPTSINATIKETSMNKYSYLSKLEVKTSQTPVENYGRTVTRIRTIRNTAGGTIRRAKSKLRNCIRTTWDINDILLFYDYKEELCLLTYMNALLKYNCLMLALNQHQYITFICVHFDRNTADWST